MRFLGQLFIAFLGAVVAIILYRTFENNRRDDAGAPTGTYAGYSFAVPSNIVRKVMTDLITFGEVQRGYLGVVIQDLSWQLAQQLGIDISQGVVIANLVRNGPADKAGLKVKDVILEIEGRPVQSSSRLMEIVAAHKPGDAWEMVIQRDGRKQHVSVRLQEAKEIQRVGS